MRKLTTALAAAILSAAVYLPVSAKAQSIVDIAKDAGTFNTLLAAATAAGFADELDEVNNLTVFAPTDDAFAALPPGTVDDLLLPENRDTLRAIIAYHILPNRVKSTKIPKRPVLAETLNGCERVRVERVIGRKAKVFVDGVKIETANIKASNGFIHVIGEVLLPDRACP
jgi:uncharacterized surface protein with fasciclin (FAS1) repeats